MVRTLTRTSRTWLTAVATVPLVAAGCGSQDRNEQPLELDSQVEEGPYEVMTDPVEAENVAGRFGGGTLYYPDDNSETYAVIVAAPGLGARENMVSWYGDLLASHGFILLTMDTLATNDQPDARGAQILEALEYVIEDSAASAIADPHSRGVLGHSMGGGGALVAAAEGDIDAVVALTPYYGADRDWSALTAATLIIGGEYDQVTTNEEHAEPLYEAIDNSQQKAYLNLYGDHFVANSPSRIVTEQVVAWFTLFLDEDSTYANRLCPPPQPGEGIVEYRDTCPS
ncbi:alpha/beta hydrolase family protein [Natronoglycomyces albus]|uniref:Dienelactone hydrolase family protein n=1 Tax=Natronoglycomyces albus TaxID=2811108 RepID=A0A895XLG3_9ACTN|nr:dienelactone hydrolase family protein [Natronoglycomyces albus]QSB04393.1 dienelactone hydrolase family protein [Natronoglycomyces albus]